MSQRYGVLAAVVGSSVVLDQASKLWAESWLRGRGIVQVVDGYFDLRLSRNRGAFFSLGEHLPASLRAGFFIVTSLVAVTLVLSLFRRTQLSQRRLRAGLMLLCAGALGNMIDRARRGEVTDFMHLHLREIFQWATFNVADICITFGLLLLLLDAITQAPRPHHPA